MPELLTPKDVAKQIGVSQQWVTELIRRGEIEAQRISDRWAITQEAVDRYMEKRKKSK